MRMVWGAGAHNLVCSGYDLEDEKLLLIDPEGGKQFYSYETLLSGIFKNNHVLQIQVPIFFTEVVNQLK